MEVAVIGGSREQDELISLMLNSAGFVSSFYENGDLFLSTAPVSAFYAYIIDLDLVGVSTEDSLLTKIRDRVGFGRPILLLAGQNTSEQEIVAALRLGADDCLREPIRGGELTARINALMRRAYPSDALASHTFKFGRYAIDVVSRKVTLDGRVIPTTRREFDLAWFFFTHMGTLIPRDVLESAVWGRNFAGKSKTVDTHIYRIRSKLNLSAENGLVLTASYGRGFQLTPLMNFMEI